MAELPWPFVGSEALAARVIPERAMRTLYEPVYPDVYIPWRVAPSAVARAKAAWLWSRRRGTVAGQSAAAMLGTKWVDGAQPAELIHDNRKPPPKLIVHSEALATDVKLVDIESVISAHPGARGMSRLRRVLPLVDGGAESPQETLTRLVLIDAGLPCPRTQIQVYDGYEVFVARIDMGYEDVRVGIEYDGPQHWTDPAVRQHDIDRQVALQDLGWKIIRASRDLLKFRRSTFVARVASALRDRG
jgi:hypothetical protein